MKLRTIKSEKKWKGKRVLVRVDFNVPIVRGKVPANDRARIQAALPTIQWLMKQGARVVLVTHVGRPNGRRVASLSTKPIADALARLGVRAQHVRAVVGPKAKQATERLKDGEAVLLENVRFHKGEEANSPTFAKQLAALGDIFVNNAFAVSHRRHASLVGVAQLLPSYAGLLLSEEIAMLDRVLGRPRRPFVVVIGGAKIKTKFPIIKNLLQRADHVLLGGALANTFFLAAGYHVGTSLAEPSLVPEARRLLRNKKLCLPVDLRVLPKQGSRSRAVVRAPHTLTANDYVVDIGPNTVAQFTRLLAKANTLIWNGPVGVCEVPRFAKGSHALARAFVRRAQGKPFGLVGGGDTLPCIAGLGDLSGIDFISTGGGAMLEYLGGITLPALNVLKK
jgi:phosphoglycerate kinase